MSFTSELNVLPIKVDRYDPVHNPFSPGAGNQPPELAGREEVLADVAVTLQRIRNGAFSRSAILVGLRGAGETVLLNRAREIAADLGIATVFVEAHEDERRIAFSPW